MMDIIGQKETATASNPNGFTTAQDCWAASTAQLVDDILASEGAGRKRLVEADSSQVVGCGARQVEVGRKVAGEEVVEGNQDIGGRLDVVGRIWVALQAAPQQWSSPVWNSQVQQPKVQSQLDRCLEQEARSHEGKIRTWKKRRGMGVKLDPC